LHALHPSNRHIRPKIRQQLQVLRNLGLLEFVLPGEYRMKG
jgi:type II restriction enzyme